ncbi:MAG: AtpZ/AtpI family protein [Candidatus Aminicenantes bacterium]|jgi:ATP synthase protein I|nr:AtpZ/AtpI family protein [Candidatus Aminicenantes bacterium]
MTVMNEDKSEEKKKLAAYSTIGLMFPTSIAIGLAMGYFLDKLFKTSPYLLIIFTLYGIAAGFWNLFKVTKQYDKRK